MVNKIKINIVIPMAGNGSRFVQAGYKNPKPFIDVNGKSMIQRVMDNLAFKDDNYEINYFLIAKQEHLNQEEQTVKYLKEKYNVTFITIDKTTEGAACSVLFARKYINNDDMLIFANSDQIVDFNVKNFIDDAINKNLDGSILTFIDKERSPKWSFAQIDNNNIVKKVAEKQVISQYATVGIYLFQKGSIFVNGAIDMIINNDRFNNEFYVCPVYNYVIKNKNTIGIFNIDYKQMHGLGTPEDLQKYLSNSC
jgi:UDP-N-acetylglucosamine diphosphorylase / glucose-1-phosphate thymidylyltransferase / UDP-N-acetylgalactosamine diphosphorylase / glucosamine-1-phosphate N-acetyltransferase / galactosamine-1-phosphate N-acetyltransferase